jgi:aldose 1-epimerase
MTVTEHNISFGPYTAIVTQRSGALRELRHDGRDLVITFGPEGEIPDYRGTICAPWPNRLADGAYAYGGVKYQAEINEPERGTALHGLVIGKTWEVQHQGPSSISLGTTVSSGPEYPGDLDVAVSYELKEDGLHSTVRAHNSGQQTAPYGVCPHPYLVAGPAPLDEWTLQMPAATFLDVTPDRLLPVQTAAVEGHDFDFREERRLGSVEIDHAFTDIETTSRSASVRVFDPSGSGVELEWDDQWPWLQIHTADKPTGPTRLGLAVEPMTCPPDAFNSGVDLVELAPGATHEATWIIRALNR